MKTKLLFTCFCCFLSGCVTNGSENNSSLTQLKSGECPEKIIGKHSWDTIYRSNKNKYGIVEKNELDIYKISELKNCEARANDGDVEALYTLGRYWHSEKNGRKNVNYYKQYLDKSNNNSKKAKVARDLYFTYYQGRYGIPKNKGLAHKYLIISAELGNKLAQNNYASSLKGEGRYDEAMSYYTALADDSEYGCRASMNIAEAYFKGWGVNENWYIGYYYWIEGLSRAKTPDMGLCEKTTVQYDVITASFDRKKYIDALLATLSQQELDEIQSAWVEYETKGLSYVSAMPFEKRRISVASKKQVSNKYSSSERWKKWKPVSNQVCKYRTSNKKLDSSGVYTRVSDSIWTITSGRGKTRSLGSGVAISNNELITNCHIIVNPDNIQLSKGNKKYTGMLKSSDRKSDRCIVESKGNFNQYVSRIRKTKSIGVGEDVFAIGNPQGLDASLSKGVVAQKRVDGGRSYIQTDAAISPGSSGGGLFDSRGNLIGITTFKVADGENLNFAISVDEFCRIQ